MPNVKDAAECQHVALTKDGILYVRDKHATCCRIQECMQGKVSKTVPYDKLTDCDIEEPAGEECCAKKTLEIVNIDTASGNRGGGEGPAHELQLAGLLDAKGFKTMVWKLKRGELPGCVSSGSSSAPAQQGMISGMGATIFGHAGDSGNAEVVRLLEKNNELLAQIEANTRK
eukprot:CAMPEP_0180460144 /NCGR_PEP_ID=MMETSP1036_2-20121128/23215_1 /TAXON_ID=632150 /ORGANISM="Azadinium spinosum, Strain 3D9" /LENGTH=171 /DNA_ID=CAMNT_0022466831 /DNA_START=152 /DNA_END=667 /DNA_ORIENTATION=+